jgi:hypothetical protein
VDQPITQPLGFDEHLKAFEPGPAGLEHFGESAQQPISLTLPPFHVKAERLERGRDEGRPLEGFPAVAHLELERGQGGQLPHQAQRRQLRPPFVSETDVQAQLVHASRQSHGQDGSLVLAKEADSDRH